MTEEEKSGLVHEVVEEIKRQTQDVSELPVSDNIEDFTSLPVVDREGRLKRFSVSELKRELGKGQEVELVQQTGQAEDKAMSQKAVTTAIEDVSAKVEQVKTDVSGVSTRVSEVSTEVSAVKTEVETLKVTTATATTEINTMKADMEALKGGNSSETENGNHTTDPDTHHVLSQTEKNRISWATYLQNKENSSVFLQVNLADYSLKHLRLACNIADQSDRIHGIFCFDGVYMIEGAESIGNKAPIFSSMSPYVRSTRLISSDNGYRRYIKPLVDKGILGDGMYIENECYYAAGFNNGVSIIILNPYDNDDLEENEYWEPVEYNESYPQGGTNRKYTYDENTPVFVNFESYTKHSFRLKKTVTTGYGGNNDNTVPRFRTGRHICFSQKQLEWLCERLQDGLDSFIIAAPAPLCQGMTQVKGKFSHEPKHLYPIDSVFPTAMETDVIKEIMKAYKESRQLNIKVRYKEDGPAAYLNTQTDEEGHKYAFTLSYQFRSNGDEFKGFLGETIFEGGTILKDSDSGFYSVHPPRSYYEIDSNLLEDFRFNAVGLCTIGSYNDGGGLDPAICRIARVGYDLNDDGSVDDVLELKSR